MALTAPRLMHALTAAYGAYAIARPDHLARGLGEQPNPQARRLAQALGVRDLATSALALSGSPRLVRAATVIRVASDLGDAAYLGSRAGASSRPKILGVTLGWASLNLAADLLHRRRS